MHKANSCFGSGVFTTALILLLWAQPILAQTSTGKVGGTITDSSKAAVPGARVTLKNLATAIESTSTSNERGIFLFVNVQPGNYSLIIEREGFSRAQEDSFTVSVNQFLIRDITLSLGQVSETVRVAAEAPLLQTSSTELGTVINNKAVGDLPLNGRNFTQLLTLTPGATPVQTSQGSGDPNNTRCSLCDVTIPGSPTFRPSINGQWNRSNLYYLDGVLNTNILYSGYTILPVIDAIQEFKVQSHNDKAEYGGVLGGVVNLVSKSGSNEFHGGLWEFLRNNIFNARDPFKDALSKSAAAFRQNQFGAAVGGPIFRNKTFFFATYEGWRYTQAQQSLYRVPTERELSGNFSDSILNRDIFDPTTTRPNPSNPSALLRDPFPERIIPASRIFPMVTSWIRAYLGAPNYTGDPFFNALNPRKRWSNADSYQLKLDHQFSSSDNVWVRYSRFDNSEVAPTTLVQNNAVYRPRTNAALGWNRVLRPNLILSVRGAYSRLPFDTQTVYTAGLSPAIAAGFRVAGLAPGITLQTPWGGGAEGHGYERQDDGQVSSNLSWLKGNHAFSFGAQWLPQKYIQKPQGYVRSFNFADRETADLSRIGTTGASLASALIGVPRNWTDRTPSAYGFTWPTWGLYAQDEWKVRRQITISLGLRWDKFVPPTVTLPNVMTVFDVNTGIYLIGLDKLPGPCSVTGASPCIPGDGTLAGIPFGDHIRLADHLGLRAPRNNGFGPRAGIAWQVGPKTVVRAGYGLVWDVFSGIIQEAQNHISRWPVNLNFTQDINPDGASPLVLLSSLQVQASPVPAPTPWTAACYCADPNKKNQLSHQFNVQIQRQVTECLAIAMGYVGSRSSNLEETGLGNAAPTPGPGTAAEVNARRPWPFMIATRFGTDRGRAAYNSFQFSANQKVSRGLQFLLAYTWSKTIDNGTSGWFAAENGPSGDAALQDYNHPEASRSVSSYDVPQFLSLSAVYELPFGKGKTILNSGPVAQIVGGWQTNAVVQVRSGQPYTLNVQGDVANIGSTSGANPNYGRPNLIGNPHPAQPTVSQAFNPQAFAVPQFAFGNFGRNVLRSEKVANTDFSLFRTFRLWKEQTKLQIRAEGFNVFNIMSYGTPAATIGLPNAGRISSVAIAPRQWQFGAKIMF